MPRKPEKTPEPAPEPAPDGHHYIWAPANSSWLQDGGGGHYPPGSVIPADVAEDPELSADARSNIRIEPGEAEPAIPHKRPWAQ